MGLGCWEPLNLWPWNFYHFLFFLVKALFHMMSWLSCMWRCIEYNRYLNILFISVFHEFIPEINENLSNPINNWSTNLALNLSNSISRQNRSCLYKRIRLSENSVSKRAVEFLKENSFLIELWPFFYFFTTHNRYHYLWKCRMTSPRQYTA